MNRYRHLAALVVVPPLLSLAALIAGGGHGAPAAKTVTVPAGADPVVHRPPVPPPPLFFRKGNGSSPEKAVVVGSIDEEYGWMERHHPGFRPAVQALHIIDGKPYDVLTWRNAAGEKRTVYFDISTFFGR